MPKIPPYARTTLVTLARVALIAAVYAATTLPPPWQNTAAQASPRLSVALTTGR
ncbi:hypothetical protein [Azospirillum halopraeferens]|uniref:hypothetical protein n=1 Tax=Azospirillum halopraeferens TaxID=34010 RepID=UPI00041CA1C8|nr:hypothetical protein [Azospirillum halopraeferens]